MNLRAQAKEIELKENSTEGEGGKVQRDISQKKDEVVPDEADCRCVGRGNKCAPLRKTNQRPRIRFVVVAVVVIVIAILLFRSSAQPAWHRYGSSRIGQEFIESHAK